MECEGLAVKAGNLVSCTLLSQVTMLSLVAQDIPSFSTESHASWKNRTVGLPTARAPSGWGPRVPPFEMGLENLMSVLNT